MSSLTDVFKTRAFDVFDREDINEPLLLLYQQLALALRDKSSGLILNETELIHIVDGRVSKRLPMSYGMTSIYETAKRNLLLIFERDTLVNKYFRLTTMTNGDLTVDVIRS